MYADGDQYTYPLVEERLLVQSLNWPADVNAQLARLGAENVRLEGCNAWLENEIGSLRQEVESLKVRVGGIGRKLSKVVKIVESESPIERMEGFHGGEGARIEAG